MSRLDDIKYGFWIFVALPAVAFVVEKAQGLFWYFSNESMQERHWARLERKAAEKKRRK